MEVKCISSCKVFSNKSSIFEYHIHKLEKINHSIPQFVFSSHPATRSVLVTTLSLERQLVSFNFKRVDHAPL
jgi:hypothetical protein